MEPLGFFFFFAALMDRRRYAKGECPRQPWKIHTPPLAWTYAAQPQTQRAAVTVQFWGHIPEVNGCKNKKATAAFTVLNRRKAMWEEVAICVVVFEVSTCPPMRTNPPAKNLKNDMLRTTICFYAG